MLYSVRATNRPKLVIAVVSSATGAVMAAQPRVPLTTDVVAKTIGQRPEHALEDMILTVSQMMSKKSASHTNANETVMVAANNDLCTVWNAGTTVMSLTKISVAYTLMPSL